VCLSILARLQPELFLCLQVKLWPWADHFIVFCSCFSSCSTLAGDISGIPGCGRPYLHSAPSLKGATESTKCCNFPARALGASVCSVSKSHARVNIAELRTFGLLRSKSSSSLLCLCHWHLFLQSPRPLRDVAVCSVSQELIVPFAVEPLNWKRFLRFPGDLRCYC